MFGEDTYRKLIRIPGISAILARFKSELPFEFEHAESLFELVHNVAQEMGFETEQVEMLGGAALVHDSGKLLRPDIYNAPKQISDRERTYLRLHTKFGHRMIIGHGISKDIALIADGHHEHCSDRYPRDVYSNGHDIAEERRTTNQELFLMQQLLCACDYVDAQLRDRSYRAAKPLEVVTAGLKRDFRGETRVVEAVLAQNLKQMYN
jgi:HD-GYP domain-containing protein (c-di-GMP phosphodiesterase class II)